MSLEKVIGATRLSTEEDDKYRRGETKLSKHNYSQYSDKKKPIDQTKPIKAYDPVDVPVTKTPLVSEFKMEVKPVQETVKTTTLHSDVSGVVVNCAKLNVRSEPSVTSEVVCVLDVMSEIKIDAAKSDNQWLKVYTATGIEGYCMRKFVDAHL